MTEQPTPRDAQAPSLSFESGPAIPEMREGLLASEDVESLCQDIAACTELIAIQEKSVQQGYATAAPPTVTSACERLLSGAVRGVQFSYRFDGRQWTDTLFKTPAGYRLVRCQHAVRPECHHQ